MFDKIRNAFGVNRSGSAGSLDGFAQKRRLFQGAFDQMDLRTRHVGERASDDQSRKTRTGAKIDPYSRLGREREKLQGIGDVPRPQLWLGRSCDQIGVLLPVLQNGDKAVETDDCFT